MAFVKGFQKAASMIKLAPPKKSDKKSPMVQSGTARVTSKYYTGYAVDSNDPQDG